MAGWITLGTWFLATIAIFPLHVHDTPSTLGDEKNEEKIGITIQELNMPLNFIIYPFPFILVHYLQESLFCGIFGSCICPGAQQLKKLVTNTAQMESKRN
jgi:hypothetical protein